MGEVPSHRRLVSWYSPCLTSLRLQARAFDMLRQWPGVNFFHLLPRTTIVDPNGSSLRLVATVGSPSSGEALPLWLHFDGRSFQGTAPEPENLQISLRATWIQHFLF